MSRREDELYPLSYQWMFTPEDVRTSQWIRAQMNYLRSMNHCLFVGNECGKGRKLTLDHAVPVGMIRRHPEVLGKYYEKRTNLFRICETHHIWVDGPDVKDSDDIPSLTELVLRISRYPKATLPYDRGVQDLALAEIFLDVHESLEDIITKLDPQDPRIKDYNIASVLAFSYADEWTSPDLKSN